MTGPSGRRSARLVRTVGSRPAGDGRGRRCLAADGWRRRWRGLQSAAAAGDDTAPLTYGTVGGGSSRRPARPHRRNRCCPVKSTTMPPTRRSFASDVGPSDPCRQARTWSAPLTCCTLYVSVSARSAVLFMHSSILLMEPEAVCFRIVRLPVRACVLGRMHSPTSRPSNAVDSLFCVALPCWSLKNQRPMNFVAFMCLSTTT